MLGALLWLIGCDPTVDGEPLNECLTDPPAMGEVRSKQIRCTAEIPEYGEARIGDWVLENASIRLTIRNQPNRLTQLTGGGGTIIDVDVDRRGDDIIELVPIVEDGWPDRVDIMAEDGTIRLTDGDDPSRTWSYRLDPLSGRLHISGADGVRLVPNPGTELIGSWAHGPRGTVVASASAPTDAGGWLQWTGDTLYLGTSSTVTRDIFSSESNVTFESDASHLELRTDGTMFTRFEVKDGLAAHYAPEGSEVRATTAGHEPSPWSSARAGQVEPIGEHGFIEVEPITVAEEAVPFTVVWNDMQYSLSAEGGTVPVGPGPGEGRVTAGPRYTPYTIPFDEVVGTRPLIASLDAVIDRDAWVAFATSASPGPYERRTSKSLLSQLASEGFDYAVLVAEDEVAEGVPASESAIPSHAGSAAVTPQGTVIAWPWSRDSRSAAHGAAPWHALDTLDLLPWMSKAGRRYTAVDTAWFRNVGDALRRTESPDLLVIKSPSDLSTIADAYDRWMPIGLIGKTNWVHTDSRVRDGILRAMLEGRSTPSTGPNIQLNVSGYGPGDMHDGAWTDETGGPIAELSLEAAGDVTHVALVGPGGEALASWSTDELPVTHALPPVPWVVAIAQGPADWAITSAVWLERP